MNSEILVSNENQPNSIENIKKELNTKHRINVDLPLDVFEFLRLEQESSTITTKAMCQKIIIDYVRNKKIEGKRLI
jgi:hypothetical protein